MRSFFLYQQSHFFAVLTSSIPDATQQLLRKWPYARTFYEVFCLQPQMVDGWANYQWLGDFRIYNDDSFIDHFLPLPAYLYM